MQHRLAEVSGRDVSRETFERIERYKALLLKEAERQNLISRATFGELDERHIVDGAQLLRHAPSLEAHWLDVGSGAGLPGIVLAILHPGPVTLVEPRRLRADFLTRVVEELALSNTTVIQKKIEQVTAAPSVITGRAVASVAKFLSLTEHLADLSTIYVLPKGKKAREELEEAEKSWQGRFELVPSATDEEASILIAGKVRRKGGR